VQLGHRYRTDVLEVHLGIPGTRDDYLSALEATMAALPGIGVARSDVRGMLNTFDVSQPPALVLVDAVPGGAGHAQRIAPDLEALLTAAYANASSCKCAPQTSCYACLRAYENQTVEDRLSREGACRVLEPFA